MNVAVCNMVRAACFALLLWLSPGAPAQPAGVHDLVLTGAGVIDPETYLDAVHNIAIGWDKIIAVASGALRARPTIDARRLIAAPGFIDQHSQASTDETARYQAKSQGVESNPGRTALVEWVRENAVSLPPCDLGATPSRWDALGAIVGRARVVALGEPVHGAHEPLAFRNCLFRFLVEQQGFSAIALESGLSESRRLHDFVAGGPGDAPAVVNESLTWGFGRFAENVALVEWMRSYNLDPAHPLKIAFYGMDLSGGDEDGNWSRSRMTLDASLNYLSRFDPSGSARVRAALQPFQARFTVAGYMAMQPDERVQLRDALVKLVLHFDCHRSALLEASGFPEYDWSRQNAVVANQIESTLRVSRAPDGKGIAPDGYHAASARDAAMAENVRWIVDREHRRGRVLVFAHDGHVMNAPKRGGIWSVYSQPAVVMGQHLRAAFGRSLVIVPILSSADDPRDPGRGHAGELDGAMGDAGLDRFAVDCRPLRNRIALGWFGTARSVRLNYSTEAIIEPQKAFDALLFMRELTPAIRREPEGSSGHR